MINGMPYPTAWKCKASSVHAGSSLEILPVMKKLQGLTIVQGFLVEETAFVTSHFVVLCEDWRQVQRLDCSALKFEEEK